MGQGMAKCRRCSCAPGKDGKSPGHGGVRAAVGMSSAGRWALCMYLLGSEGGNICTWLWVQNRAVLQSHPLAALMDSNPC